MPRRVLHLLSQKPGWTGSGIALRELVRAAAAGGWEQGVVVGVAAEDGLPEIAGIGSSALRSVVFETRALPFRLPGMSDVMPYPSSPFSELTDGQLAAYRDAWRDVVRAAIADFRPDVIHSHHVWLMSSWVKDLCGEIPVVTHCHGTGLRQARLCPHMGEEVRAGCARNEAFLALHREHARALGRHLDIESGRIHVVGSGYREEIFHDRDRQQQGSKTVAYAGKLSAAKGLPWLIEAMERVAEQVPGAKLHIAGSGSGGEADAIRAQIDASELVVFHGQLGQEALADLLRRSSVFVLPSFFEGLPLVLVEAAACGCRLIATRLPGVVEELQPKLEDRLDVVDLPRLEGVDRPVEEDLPGFIDRLTLAIVKALEQPSTDRPGEATADMTWKAVFGRVESVWRFVIDP